MKYSSTKLFSYGLAVLVVGLLGASDKNRESCGTSVEGSGVSAAILDQTDSVWGGVTIDDSMVTIPVEGTDTGNDADRGVASVEDVTCKACVVAGVNDFSGAAWGD